MSRTWILVAESSRAKLYAANGNLAPLSELEDLVHPAEKMAVSGVDVGRGFNGDPVAVDGERTGGIVSLACIKVFAVAKNRGCHGIPTVRTPHLYLPDTV